MKKIRVLLMMVLCLAFASTAAFASSAVDSSAVDQVRSLHGHIIEISGNMVTIEGENPQDVVAVHLNWDTEIVNGRNGNDVDFNRLEVGDELTAYYSASATRSLPPQSRAYALVMGNGEHDAIYMQVAEVNKVKNGVEVLNSNEDTLVTIPTKVEDDANELRAGDRILVWYDFVAMSMPGKATATKAEILD